MPGFLTISNSRELMRFPTDSIVYVAGSGDYSNITMADGKVHMVTCQLGQIEDMLRAQLKQNGRDLVRIGKSLIINLAFLTYINPVKKTLTLSDCRMFEFQVSASREALSDLKTYFEQLANLNG